MAQDDQEQAIKCPHCEKEFGLNVKAVRNAQTVLSFVITPEPGHMLSAGSIGGMLSAFERLMNVMSKDMGGHCLTMIKGMAVEASGALKFDFLIVTNESALYKKHKGAKAAKASTEQVG